MVVEATRYSDKTSLREQLQKNVCVGTKWIQAVLQNNQTIFSPASRAPQRACSLASYPQSLPYTCSILAYSRELCMIQVTSLFSLLSILIVVRLLQRVQLWLLVFRSINGCLHSKKIVWQEKTRLTSPEVWAAATSKVWHDSLLL